MKDFQYRIRTSREKAEPIVSEAYEYKAFASGEHFPGKKEDRLPIMGWNSWNAFGSGNTEALTLSQAKALKDLGLADLGYTYVVLDDGCYMPERVNGRLANEPVKFPRDFSFLADDLHAMGLKFGMYNDIGTNLCAGAAVGTCGFEDVDAQSYVDWKIDFLKVDNCYYLWDNATFSNPENARFTFAPSVRSLKLVSEGEYAAKRITQEELPFVGTFDGTNVGRTPVGDQSLVLVFEAEVPEDGTYLVKAECATGRRPGLGTWLQVTVDESGYLYDGEVAETAGEDVYEERELFEISLSAGKHVIRIMNHRRQENTLNSYAAMFYALKEADPERDIVLSICEWGKTQPQNWGYKIGDSWRILNDITFCVGRDGDPGRAEWERPGTDSITTQYDKAVVMDRYAGLKKGWNDPDMLVVGMGNLNREMMASHMAMWCMMNSPLMLGLDLRKVQKGDEIWNIIANRDLIALNQDPLGRQARRVYCSACSEAPDLTYVTDHDRTDVLVKLLAGGELAVLFQNLSKETRAEEVSLSLEEIRRFFPEDPEFFDRLLTQAEEGDLVLTDLWTGEQTPFTGKVGVTGLDGCSHKILRLGKKGEMKVGDLLEMIREAGSLRGREKNITWTMTPLDVTLERRMAAGILHQYLQVVLDLPDLDADERTLALQDLYECNHCTGHLIQAVGRGLIFPKDETHYDLISPLSRAEAVLAVSRLMSI